jgi:hypothetical protein
VLSPRVMISPLPRATLRGTRSAYDQGLPPGHRPPHGDAAGKTPTRRAIDERIRPVGAVRDPDDDEEREDPSEDPWPFAAGVG